MLSWKTAKNTMSPRFIWAPRRLARPRANPWRTCTSPSAVEFAWKSPLNRRMASTTVVSIQTTVHFTCTTSKLACRSSSSSVTKCSPLGCWLSTVCPRSSGTTKPLCQSRQPWVYTRGCLSFYFTLFLFFSTIMSPNNSS